jgi:hypothetical protein
MHPIKAYEEMEVQLPLILNLGTRFGKWPASRHGRLTTAEQPPVQYPLRTRLRGTQTLPERLAEDISSHRRESNDDSLQAPPTAKSLH